MQSRFANLFPHALAVLGTDGYGRSDTRDSLRKFFEVSREYVVIAALKVLGGRGLDKTECCHGGNALSGNLTR